MQFGHIANRPGADHFDAGAKAGMGRALVAHLSAKLLFVGQFPQNPGFFDRVS